LRCSSTRKQRNILVASKIRGSTHRFHYLKLTLTLEISGQGTCSSRPHGINRFLRKEKVSLATITFLVVSHTLLRAKRWSVRVSYKATSYTTMTTTTQQLYPLICCDRHKVSGNMKSRHTMIVGLIPVPDPASGFKDFPRPTTPSKQKDIRTVISTTTQTRSA
jgi:hypothetical protein